jgi:hypothetical protein
MERLFALAASFNQPIGSWETKRAVYMGHMFEEAANFNQPVGPWDFPNVTNMEAMLTNGQKSCPELLVWQKTSKFCYFHYIQLRYRLCFG